MTVGKDVSTLFPDVINCIQTGTFRTFREDSCNQKIVDSLTSWRHILYFNHLVNDSFLTDNLELKKLVYLYLINYAKTHPDLALLAVNTFVKDANDPVS
jgi:vesicle coat complex subunit